MLGKLTIQRRLVLLNLSVAICFSAMLVAFLKEKNEPINFAVQEKRGDQYQRPLESLLDGLAKHRIFAQRALSGSEPAWEAIPQLQDRIDSSLADLVKVDGVIGVDLQFTDEGLKQRKREGAKPSIIVADWKKLKSDIKTLTATASNDAHANLIGKVRTLISHAGDTSNLILDPDLDSYYLMDVTLLAVPQAQDRIQNALVTLEPFLNQKELKPDQRIQAALFAAAMKEADLDRITADVQTSVNEDPNFYGKFPGYSEKINASTEAFAAKYQALIDLTKKIADPTQAPVTAEAYATAAQQALDQSYKYWTSSADMLDGLLQTRIDSHVSKRTWTTSICLIFLVLLTGFIAVVNRTIATHLSRVIDSLKKEAQELGAESNTLSATSRALSGSAANSANSLQQSASSLEEISSMVKRSAENATSSIAAAEESNVTASRGKHAVEELTNAIDRISKSNSRFIDQVNTSNQRMSSIIKVISEIGDKTKIINDIVFQTKLLSFNASVEAARAGEHGKGFAVVAEEIGNLAQMSGSAAKEINDMLNTSISTVNAIVDESKQAVQGLIVENQRDVDRGLQISKQCKTVLEEVVQKQTELASLISEISTASQEQAQGVTEISKAVGQLDESTHENSSIAQQTAGSAEQITEKVRKLSAGISSLQILVSRQGTQVAS